MLQLGNVKGWIAVDGKELSEYGVQYSEDGKEATCWIPSKVGQNFAICWENDECSLATASKILVDGVKFNGRCFRPSYISHKSEQRGVGTSPTTEKLFVFSQVELTDDDKFLMALPGLGEIRVTIAEVAFAGLVPRNHYQRDVSPSGHKVHERSKKGIVHGIGLEGEVRRKPINQTRIRDIRQLATFVFKYRPLDVLQADGIAPKYTPPASQPSKTKDVEEALVEGSGSLSARKRALREELRQIEELESRKRKSEGGGGRVKKERRELVQLGDVIDLT